MAKLAKPTQIRKPRPDFPLTPHPAGYWCKKVRGKTHYFGRVDADPKGEAAAILWAEQKDDLLAGRTPRPKRDGLTVEDLCDHFLNHKRPFITSGELSKRTLDEYLATGKRLLAAFGKDRPVDDLRPEDFDKLRADISEQWGPVRLANEIQRVRTFFKFGFEAGHIATAVRYGANFKKPSRKVMRKARAAKGSKMIEAPELLKIIDAAGMPMKCFILLALNAGIGNSDIGHMPLSAIDLKCGWIDYPRPKTGIERRFPLWPETLEAIKATIEARPEPKADEAKGLAFVTKYGLSWAKSTPDNPISKEFRKLLDEAKLHRPGLGFYSLRQIFATIGGESRDRAAVSYIMGHADESMAAVYRERISDERLQAVVDHVRKWLWPEEKKADPKPGAKAKPKVEATAKAKPKPAPRPKRQPAAEASDDDGPVLLRMFG